MPNVPNLILRTEQIRDTRPVSTISTNPKILKNYCEPKDTKRTRTKKHPRRIHYNSDSSIPKTSDDEIAREDSKYDSSESVADSFQNFNEPEYANQLKTGTNPSPYYYADLLHGADGGAIAKKVIRSSLPDPTYSRPPNFTNILDPLPITKKERKSAGLQKRHSFSERDANRCDTFSSTTSDDSNCTECIKRRESRGLATNNNCDSVRSEVPSPAPGPYNCCGDDYQPDNSVDMAPHRLFRPGCLCTDLDAKDDGQIEHLRPKSVFYVHQDGEECVDCSLNNISGYLTQDRSQDDDAPYYGNVSRSTGNIGDNDHINISSAMLFDLLQDKRDTSNTNKNQNLINCDLNNKLNENELSIDLQNLNLTNCSGNGVPASSTNLPTPRYSKHHHRSPPSTAPLPIKFSGNHANGAGAGSGSAGAGIEPTAETPHRRSEHGKKSSGRHASKKCAHSMVLPSDRVLQLKQNSRRGRQNFSSNESMTPSSSLGSMESIRSSTSEGNCSTSSTESHLSASLSSHSSDSSSIRNYPLRTPVIVHANMNILSPISDKSLEPGFSDLGDGPMAKKSLQLSTIVTGAESGAAQITAGSSTAADKAKRRYLQNRASLLKDEIQGSDSGISLQSRDEIKSKNLALHNFNNHQAQHLIFNNSELSLPEDIANLPFDMPKLRSRKIVQDQVVYCDWFNIVCALASSGFLTILNFYLFQPCPSGSATSVDLGDLPFDMPKLKRRLRGQPQPNSFHAPDNTDTSGISLASSSQSMRDENRPSKSKQII